MNNERTVVVIGSGGAEAALVKKYGESPHVDRIIAIPGNDMMQELVPDKPVDVFPEISIRNSKDIVEVLEPLRREIAFVDIRDEHAIEDGLASKVWRWNIKSCSPNKHAGRLEWDKAHTRDMMQDLEIDQPRYNKLYFKDGKTPKNYDWVVHSLGQGVSFVKANGLADGKGVIKAENSEQIHAAIQRLRREYPQATDIILVERGLVGEEFSAFAICAGGKFKILGYAQDHKRALDGDEGENTGGMGAVSNPMIVVNDPTLQHGVERTYAKVVERQMQRGKEHNAKGILYEGVMAVEENGGMNPYFLEYNTRWGDPEAQVLLPGLSVDLFELNYAIASSQMPDMPLTNDGMVRVAIAGTSMGYPGDYSHAMGKEITGFDAAKKIEGVTVLGAGVVKEDGKYYTNAGRLFNIVGVGRNVIEASSKAYEGMGHIRIKSENGENLLHFRTDIGGRDVERLNRNG